MASASTREAREKYELKQRAVKFYDKNGVPKKMEEILNSMFYDNPDDVYGHLVRIYFNCTGRMKRLNHFIRSAKLINLKSLTLTSYRAYM